ncbi:MAG: glycosyltransferase family 39 protein [Acidobacteriota bacterium]
MRELNLAEEGTILYIGERILRGQVLYRDMNHHVSPGVFYLTALLMKLFGISATPTRFFMLVLFGATAALVYFLSRQVAERPFALLASVAFVFLERRYYSVIYYSPIAVFLALIALHAVLRLQQHGRVRSAALAGAAGGLALGFKQDFAAYTLAASAAGIALGLAGGGFTWRRALRAFLAYAAGYAAMILPLIAYFAARGALDDMFRYCVVFVLHGFSQDYSLPWPAPFARWPEHMNLGQKVEWLHLRVGLYGAIALFGLAAVIVVRAVVSRHFGPRARTFTTTFVLAALIFLGAFPRTDGYHVVIVLPPALVLFAMTLSIVAQGMASDGRTETRELATFGLAALVAIPVAYGSWRSLCVDLAERAERSVPIGYPRAPMFLGAPKAAALAKVLAYVKGHVTSKDGLFVLPYEPGIYYLSGIDNPTRYDMILPGNVNADSEREIVETLEKKQVPYVLLIEQYHFDFLGFRKLWQYAPTLHRYLYENYRIPADYQIEPTANVGIVAERVTRRPSDEPEILVDLVDSFRDYGWGTLLKEGRKVPGTRIGAPFLDETKGWWNVGIRDWMMRRVVFIHPEVASEKRRYVDYRVTIPPRAVLRTGLSLFEEVWDKGGRGVVFEVAASDGPSERGLLSKLVDPFHVPEHRRWLDYEIDLSRYAGREVTLSLRTGTPVDTNEYAWAGFGGPRIVRYPEGAGPLPDDRGSPVARVADDFVARRSEARETFARDGAVVPSPGDVAPFSVKSFGPEQCLFLHTAIEPGLWHRASFEVEVPAGATLTGDYGMASDTWLAPGGAGARFRIALTDAAGAEHVLLEGEADPRSRPEDRRMFPVSCDLAPFAGQHATIRFETSSRAETNEYGWAVFGEPRIVTR